MNKMGSKGAFIAALIGLAAAILIVGHAPAGAADTEHPTLRLFSKVTVTGSGPRISGSGNTVEETRALSSFSALVLSAPVGVTLKAGNVERVTVRADDNIVPLIDTKVVGGRLEITTQPNASFTTRHKISAVVEFKQMNAITIKASGDVRADAIKTPVFEVVIRSSGDVRIDQIEADALAVSIAGSGDFVARGRVRSVGVVIEGSGDVNVDGVEAREGAIHIRSSGDVAVNAADRLEVEIAGSGDVRYRGSPQITKRVHGSGAVIQRR